MRIKYLVHRVSIRIKRDTFAKWLCPYLIKWSIVSGSTSKNPFILEITVRIKYTFYKSILVSQVLKFCYNSRLSQAKELSRCSTGCTASSHPVNCFRHRPVSLSTRITRKGVPISNDNLSLFVSEGRGQPRCFRIYQCIGLFWSFPWPACRLLADNLQQLREVLFWLHENIFHHTELRPPQLLSSSRMSESLPLLSPNYLVYTLVPVHFVVVHVLMTYFHLHMLITSVS